MVLHRMFVSPRKIVSVRDEAYSRGNIRKQNRCLLLFLIVGLVCWPFSVEVAVFLLVVSAVFIGINFMSCIIDDEDDFAFNANGLGRDYVFKSDIVEVSELDFSECRNLDRLVLQDISRVDQATKKVNKSINQALKHIQWGEIRDKVMWAQGEQKHLNAHTEEFVYYLSRRLRTDLSEPRNIIRTTLRNYADSLTKMADDIDKIVENRMRESWKPLEVRRYHSGAYGSVEGVADEKTAPSADRITLW